MSSNSAMIIFFASVFAGLVMFIIGAVILFKKASGVSYDENYKVVAKVVTVVPRPYDYSVVIEYVVNDKIYRASFSSKTIDTYPIGTMVTWYYDKNDPRLSQTGVPKTTARTVGIILIALGLLILIGGTIISYASMTSANARGSNSFFSMK